MITCAGSPFRWVDFGAVSVRGEVFYVAMGPSIDLTSPIQKRTSSTSPILFLCHFMSFFHIYSRKNHLPMTKWFGQLYLVVLDN